MKKETSKLFKQLLWGYIRSALTYNRDNDINHACALLYVDSDTLGYLAYGIQELLKEDRHTEAKILMRLLIYNNLPFEDLAKTWSTHYPQVVDEAGFREFLEPHDEEGEEIPIPF